MENLPTISNMSDESFKSLWNRPGGLFAKLTGVGAIIGLIYLCGAYLLPFLIAVTTNVLILSVEVIAIWFVFFIITNKTFRRGVGLFWLQMMRKFYGTIVNIDPIFVLQNGINEMRKKQETVEDNITKLNQLLVSMKKKLKTYKDNFERNITKKDVLQNKLNNCTDDNERLRYTAELRLVDNDIARGKSQIEAQQNRIVTSEQYYNMMNKLRTAIDYKVRDAQSDLDYRKDNYEEAKAQQKIMSSTMAILRGTITSSMEEELAMEQVNDTINNSIAQINRMLDGSNDILTNFELNSDINSAKAQEIYQMFKEDGFDIFSKVDEKPQINIAGAIGEGSSMPEPELVEAKRTGSSSQNNRYFN